MLCINGTGILNSWAKNTFVPGQTYSEMNKAAAGIKPGSDGIRILPFGNGAERMLNNKMIGAHFHRIDLNSHTRAHIFRAVQEGIACAFRYGLDIMRENGMDPKVIRAGKNNMFLSEIFTEAFVNTTGVPVELYENDGSTGAALGAGIGLGVYKNPKDAFTSMKVLGTVEPTVTKVYNDIYTDWKELLEKQM